MEALSDMYGWTPDEILRQDPKIMDIYFAIVSGKNEAQKTSNRSMKKDMKRMR
jgi:hypothetical protein